jgi:hypothetical protein
MIELTKDELAAIMFVLLLALIAAALIGYHIRDANRHTDDYLKGYDHGKTDGICEGWKRGWTQPRLANGRFTSPRSEKRGLAV